MPGLRPAARGGRKTSCRCRRCADRMNSAALESPPPSVVRRRAQVQADRLERERKREAERAVRAVVPDRLAAIRAGEKARRERQRDVACRICGMPRGSDGTSQLCRRCADQIAAKMRARRAEHGRVPEDPSARLERHRRAAAARRDRGLCIRCGGRSVLETCAPCRRRSSANWRAWDAEYRRTHGRSRKAAVQAARKAEGLCVDCGGERGEDGTARHCRTCQDKANEHLRQWKARRRAEAARRASVDERAEAGMAILRDRGRHGSGDNPGHGG